MALQFYLILNQMMPDPDDYRAVSINPKSYTIEDVYDRMTRGGSTVTKAEALAGFEEVMQSNIELVEQGYSVSNTAGQHTSLSAGSLTVRTTDLILGATR